MTYVLCSPSMMSIDDLHPVHFSKIMRSGLWTAYMVVDFKESMKQIHKKTDKWFKDNDTFENIMDCFYYPIESSQLECENYRPRILRKVGLLQYFWDNEQLSKEQNFAFAIYNYAFFEGKNPIQFWDSVPLLNPL